MATSVRVLIRSHNVTEAFTDYPIPNANIPMLSSLLSFSHGIYYLLKYFVIKKIVSLFFLTISMQAPEKFYLLCVTVPSELRTVSSTLLDTQ